MTNLYIRENGETKGRIIINGDEIQAQYDGSNPMLAGTVEDIQKERVITEGSAAEAAEGMLPTDESEILSGNRLAAQAVDMIRAVGGTVEGPESITANESGETPTGTAADILRNVPFLPDPDGDSVRITKEHLGDWLAWVRAGRPSLNADWNPALHPRGPDGKFVERPYDIPDSVVSEIRSSNSAELLGKLMSEGELSGDDLDELLSDPSVRFDDIPDDINNHRELRGQRFRGGSKMRPAIQNIDTPDDGDLVDDENWQNRTGTTLERGDVVAYRTDAPFGEQEIKKAIVRFEGPMGDPVELEGPDGETFEEPTSGTAGIVGVYTPGDRDRLDPDEPVSDPDLLDVSVDDPRFTGNFDKTAVDEGDFLKVSGADDTFVAEVQETRFEGTGFTVETQDGETLDIGPGTAFSADELLDTGSEGIDIDDLDPMNADQGSWEMGAFEYGEGDIVRIQTRNRSATTARVIDAPDGMGGTAVVETPDGDRVEVGPDVDGQVDAIYRPPTKSAITPDTFVTSDDRDTVDLTERDGSPAERRAGIDQGEFLTEENIPAEMVENEEIPEGAYMAREGNHGTTVYRVEGYTENYRGQKEVILKSGHGRRQTNRGERVESRMKPYSPRDNATVTIDGWGDDDTALADRKQAVRDTLDQVLPKFENHDEVTDLEELDIEDDNFDRVKEEIADHLARAKDRKHAETVIARLSAVGDDKSRASASPDVSVMEGSRTKFQIEPEDQALAKTDHHELGHSVGMAYGFRGGSNDKDGETYPVTNFAWNSPDFNVPDKYGIPMPPGSDGFKDDTPLREQPMFQQTDWTEEIEQQVGQGLDGRNFTNVDSMDDIDISEGSMIQLADTPAYDEPVNWRIADVSEAESPFDEAAVTMEAKDGTTQPATIDTGTDGQPRIDWDGESDYIAFQSIQRSRKSTPDNWREDPPDADEYLGELDDDADPETKMFELADRVNRAWYRQAVAAREQDDDRASRYVIKSGYSSKQAHETMSRIHEVMRNTDINPSERAEAAQTLVRYHPDLLEGYRSLYDIPVNMKITLNEVLEREGHDFRFGEVPSALPNMTDPSREAVEDLYGGDD